MPTPQNGWRKASKAAAVGSVLKRYRLVQASGHSAHQHRSVDHLDRAALLKAIQTSKLCEPPGARGDMERAERWEASTHASPGVKLEKRP